MSRSRGGTCKGAGWLLQMAAAAAQVTLCTPYWSGKRIPAGRVTKKVIVGRCSTFIEGVMHGFISCILASDSERHGMMRLSLAIWAGPLSVR